MANRTPTPLSEVERGAIDKRWASDLWDEMNKPVVKGGYINHSNLTRAAEIILRMHDENLRLRKAIAYEARVVEAQTLDLKSLGKGRRKVLEDQVERMRALALGTWPAHYMAHPLNFEGVYKSLGA